MVCQRDQGEHRSRATLFFNLTAPDILYTHVVIQPDVNGIASSQSV